MVLERLGSPLFLKTAYAFQGRTLRTFTFALSGVYICGFRRDGERSSQLRVEGRARTRLSTGSLLPSRDRTLLECAPALLCPEILRSKHRRIQDHLSHDVRRRLLHHHSVDRVSAGTHERTFKCKTL